MSEGTSRSQSNLRRLRTPERQSYNTIKNTQRRERTRSRSALRSDRSISRQERELELEKCRKRLLELEGEVRRSRESIARGTRGRDRKSHTAEERDREDEPIGEAGRQHHCRQRRRSISQQRRRVRSRSPTSRQGGLPSGGLQDRDTSYKRSGALSFSIEDVMSLFSSVKKGLESQPSSSKTVPTKSIEHKNILPNFDPSAKNQRIDIWLRKVNECAQVYGWDERTTTHFAMQKLQGLAKVWYEGLNTILYTWPEWQNKLTNAFPCEQNYGQILEEMLKRKSRFGESIENYYYEKLGLLNQCDISGKRAVDCLIHGITDRTLKSSALAVRCSQPDELLKFLLSNKESQSNDRNYNRNKSWVDNNATSRNTHGSTKDHLSKPNQISSHSRVYCFNCKERGHPYLQCPKPLIRCTKCHKIGHKVENCINQGEPSKTMRISSSCSNSKYIKEVKVNNIMVDAFIDFGSEVTLVRKSLISNLKLVHDQVSTVMKGFGNGSVKSLGTLPLNIEVDGVEARVMCRVIDDEFLDKPVLIGQSFTEQPHIIVYKDSERLQFHKICMELPVIDHKDDEQLLEVKIFANVELYGPACVRSYVKSNFDGCLLLNNKLVGSPGQKCIISEGAYDVKGGCLDVPIYPCTIPCTLRKNFIFSRGEIVQFVRRLIVQPPGVSESMDSSVDCNRNISIDEVRLGDQVSNDDKQKLMIILNQYKHCFASNLKQLGCTDVTCMTIELNSHRPIVYRPYRLSHHERDKVQAMVGEMLDAGIIRESVSEYASPIILVRKKDGSSRMCVDYRMLNSVTVKERYPLPIIDDEIARLSGQACFITLDMSSGYYQVPIAEKCKYLTAFVTPDGLYEFNRMPFGLANAPAVFQRMVNKVLGSTRLNKATAYMDDILIFGRNPTECLDRFGDILKLLEKANLTLNLSKCEFLKSNINYLGYEIGASGIRPSEKKIQAVRDFPRPENVHSVRQFLGLASYFRKFVQNFAQIASPLTQMLKKDSGWNWGANQEEAFRTLKVKLTDRPVLAIYHQDADTELHTDASKDGVGGILLQRCQGSDSFRPVAYFSRQTSPEQKFYHSYELETLAVISALEKFRVYLLGKEFKIVTDCSALRSTFLKRDLIPRIARWWLLLQEFNCTVEYRPGVKMLHADALSRNPIENDLTNQYCVMSISEEDWLLTLQLADSELGRIKEILESNLDQKGLEYIRENYIVRNNKLFRILKGDHSNVRWVVPKGARWQICRLNHDEIGHPGIEKTLDRIKSNYWFPKMSKFVKKYVKACIDCAYTKKTSNNNEGLLHPINKIGLPFHTLHVDHLGPFIKSKRGNTYLLIAVDAFTKFVFIKPVRNTNTLNVIHSLDDIFYTFKVPDRLISDRGSCFTSNTFRKYCNDKGIKHIMNAVASPKSNGQVERYNRTIINSLKAQNLRCDEKDWDNQVGKIQWGLNNTVQKSTGRKPTEVMFGIILKARIDWFASVHTSREN